MFIFAIYVYDLQYATLQSTVLKAGIHSVLTAEKLNGTFGALDMWVSFRDNQREVSVFALLNRYMNKGVKAIMPWLNDVAEDTALQLRLKDEYTVHPAVLDNSLYLAVLIGRDVSEIKEMLESGAYVNVYYQGKTVLDVAYLMRKQLEKEEQRVLNASELEERSKELMLDNIKRAGNNYDDIIKLLLSYNAISYAEFQGDFEERLKEYLQYRHSERILKNVPKFMQKWVRQMDASVNERNKD